jgi:aspartyl aminopeptidase
MVEFNTKDRDSAFIEVVVQRWCKKIGRARLARLLCNMSVVLSRDAKKRVEPDFQKTFDSIEVDENNVYKVNKKVLKAFFFLLGRIWMSTAKVLSNSESMVII